MHLTLYRGALAPVPLRQDDFETFEEVADSLEDLIGRESSAPAGSSPEEQKKCLLAFAPHRLVKPYRLLANVAEVTLMVLDVDRCNADELADALTASNLQALMYASPSDDPDGDPDARRVRVVAPISRPIAPEDCPDTRRRFAEYLGIGPGQGVEGAIDAAKLFFCGRLHGTPPRQIWRFHV